MIFETERLIVRKLIIDDLYAFHEMQSNPKVMQFATGEPKNFEDNKLELKSLISKYDVEENDFWIYAIHDKISNNFVGTVALVKDDKDDEIGYRFLEKYWSRGYGSEICKGLIVYCKSIGMNKIIGYVVDKNIASTKILEKYNFKVVSKYFCKDIGLPETKYELIL